MRALTMAMIIFTLSSPTMAKPPLRDVAEIDDAVLAIGLADEIRKNCSQISARLLRGLQTLTQLQDRARELGYSDEEIKAYRRSETEKQRLRAEGEAWMRAQGADLNAEADWCAVGQAEITKKSQIGTLLRMN